MTTSLSNLKQASFPWLLYVYPWMPFPRRVIIYLREKGISEKEVAIVHVTNPGKNGDRVLEEEKYPARPQGSLPQLILPNAIEKGKDLSFKQSTSIIQVLEDSCQANILQSNRKDNLFSGKDYLESIRQKEILQLAEELTVAWNPIRLFGTHAGTIDAPMACRESIIWLRRTLLNLNHFYANRDLESISNPNQNVSIADIVLYQFLEFTRDCYGKDVTQAPKKMKGKDAYGRTIEEDYSNLQQFQNAFSLRPSAARILEKGEVPSGVALVNMTTWREGAWDD